MHNNYSVSVFFAIILSCTMHMHLCCTSMHLYTCELVYMVCNPEYLRDTGFTVFKVVCFLLRHYTITVLEGAGQLTLREAKNFLIRFLVSTGSTVCSVSIISANTCILVYSIHSEIFLAVKVHCGNHNSCYVKQD